MIYVALDSFERHLERVIRRASAGGHSASEATLRKIYDNSLANLRIAIRSAESGVDGLRIFDNSAVNTEPRLVLQARTGRVIRLADDFPAWLRTALRWSDAGVSRIRNQIPYSLGA